MEDKSLKQMGTNIIPQGNVPNVPAHLQTGTYYPQTPPPIANPMGVAGMEAQNDMTGFGMGNQMGTYPLAQKPTYTTRPDNIYGIGAGASKSTVVDITDPNWDERDIQKGKTKHTYTAKPDGGDKKYFIRKQKGGFGSGNKPKDKEISKRRYDRVTERWTAKANKQT